MTKAETIIPAWEHQQAEPELHLEKCVAIAEAALGIPSTSQHPISLSVAREFDKVVSFISDYCQYLASPFWGRRGSVAFSASTDCRNLVMRSPAHKVSQRRAIWSSSSVMWMTRG